MAEAGETLPAAATDPGNVLAELRAGFKALDSRFDALDQRLDSMGVRLDKHEGRLTTAESRISDLEDGVAQMTKKHEKLERILKTVAMKNMDLEARGRRYNLRITGVAETTNTGRLDLFVEKLLTDLFGREAFTDTFVVERAHRVLGPRPQPGASPVC